MVDHLGYEKGDPACLVGRQAGRGSGNSRNGKIRKKVTTDQNEVPLAVSRDRNGDFEPRIVPKHQRRLKGFDDKVISLYARGMTDREIQGHLEEMYGVNVSPKLISNINDGVIDEVHAWQSRLLDEVYPVDYLNAL